jgi:hypothetical protein
MFIHTAYDDWEYDANFEEWEHEENAERNNAELDFESLCLNTPTEEDCNE